MSLRQKFTWGDFIREQGAKAAKELKRTSEEGKKAFEAAKKAKLKEYVKTRMALQKKLVEKAEKGIAATQKQLKGLKTSARKSALMKRISRQQRALQNAERLHSRDESREL